jgi:protein TonB
LGAAFALSLLCHALALLVAPGWRSESRLAPPIIVTMVDRGSGHDGGNGSDALAAAPEPMTAPAPVVPVAKKAAPRRVAPTRRAVPGRASRTETTTALVAADPSPVGAAGDGAVARAGSGAVGAGNDGGGLGSGGHGNGGGAGAGSDGLRVFCRDCPTPDYPGRARRQGWQGTVDVELAIGRDGAVEAARVGRSSGYPTLDEVALEVVRRSRFVVPAGGNGLRGQLRYRFVLDETAARR